MSGRTLKELSYLAMRDNAFNAALKENPFLTRKEMTEFLFKKEGRSIGAICKWVKGKMPLAPVDQSARFLNYRGYQIGNVRRFRQIYYNIYKDYRIISSMYLSSVTAAKNVIDTYLGYKEQTEKVKEVPVDNYLINCSCGCEQNLLRYDLFGKSRNIIEGHIKGTVPTLYQKIRPAFDYIYNHKSLT